MNIPTHTPVSIPTHAFMFCRFFSAILVWCAWYFTSIPLTVLTVLLFFGSTLLGVKKSPLIVFYTQTCNRIFPSPLEVVDASAIRFAHGLAAILSTICLLLLVVNSTAGSVALLIFAILKTITAIGFCPAAKLHGCLMSGGTCCSFLKKGKKK